MQNDATPTLECQVYFCHLDFGRILTGVERSGVKRAQLFIKHFNIYPHFLTTLFNLSLRKNWEHLKTIGWLDHNIQITNMYEDLMEMHTGDQYPPAHWDLPKDWKIQNVNETHRSILDANDTLKMYVVYDDSRTPKETYIDYVNYFSNGKIRRDRFNYFGQLAVSLQLDTNNKTIQEDLFTPSGRKCMTRYYHPDSDKVKKIECFNQSGIMTGVFYSEEELASWWLPQRIKEKSLFLVDRNKTWTKSLIDLKNTSQIDHKIATIIHSLHVQESSDIDVLQGKLNSNYADVLDGRLKPDAMIILTQHQLQDIKQRFPEVQNLYMIPHANDRPIKKISFAQRDFNKIITMSRLAPEKRLIHLVEAMVQVVAVLPEKKLYIYGHGSQKRVIEQKVEELNLKNNVFVMDYTENVELILDQSVLFLLSSNVEGFCMALAEAISCGVPAISYDVRYGPSTMIESNKNGYLIPNGDIASLAQKMISMLQSESLEQLKNFSEYSYHMAEQYTPEKIIPLWKDFFKKIVQSH